MRVMAELAQEFSHDELRVSHEQNVILPHVHRADLPTVYSALRAAGLATANIRLISDIITCPSIDYCALATVRSIPIAQQIATHFAELKLENDIGPLKLKISVSINAWAITMWDISAFWAWSAQGWRATKSPLAVMRALRRKSARGPALGLEPMRLYPRLSVWCLAIWRSSPTSMRRFCKATYV